MELTQTKFDAIKALLALQPGENLLIDTTDAELSISYNEATKMEDNLPELIDALAPESNDVLSITVTNEAERNAKYTKAIEEAFKILKPLVEDDDCLQGASIKIINPADDYRSSVDDDMPLAILITQKYNYNLSQRASDMYLLIAPHTTGNGFRIHHMTGFSNAHSTNQLIAKSAGMWQAERAELIFSGRWSNRA